MKKRKHFDFTIEERSDIYGFGDIPRGFRRVREINFRKMDK